MIRKEDIRPDYRVLSKYIGNIPLDTQDTTIWYDYFEKHLPEFNKSAFEKLLSSNNLIEHLSNMYWFACLYAAQYSLIHGFDDIPFGEHYKTYKDFIGLISFLKNNNDSDKVSITITVPKKGPYTIKNPEISVPVLRYMIKDLLNEWLEKTRGIKGIMIDKFLKEQTAPNKRRSMFARLLNDFYNYLRSETYFNDETISNNKVYGFIIDFCLTIGVKDIDLPEDLKAYITH